MHYTSVDNKKIKELKKLQTKKYRDEVNLFLVEGYKIVEEAYKCGILTSIYVLEGETTNLDVETHTVSINVLKYLSSTLTPQPIIGVCKKRENNTIGNEIVILDNVQDPGNIGTIIRSCVAFNIDTIILSNGSVDVYNEKVIRSTMGMLFKINILYKDLESEIKKLKANNYLVIGTKVDGGKPIESIKKVDKYALIMGNEGNGVSKNILDLCDCYAYIPMNKACESLNVGVATSIIVYELKRGE